jgi:hypothetical protein
MKDYKKYKWFYTSSDKLVVGGKNAKQNDELLKKVQKMKGNFYIMHTSHPGSPFSAIISDPKTVKKTDLEECAIFTGAFSRAWKKGMKKTKIHIFRKNQISKEKNMKEGMWGVSGNIKKMTVELKLALTKQKRTLRAVPLKSSNNTLLEITPGKIDKEKMFLTIKKAIKNSKLEKEEFMAALPAGGIRIDK